MTMIDISTLSTMDWLVIILGVVTLITALVGGWLYNKERRKAAAELQHLMGPDVAIVDHVPDEEIAAEGDLPEEDTFDISLTSQPEHDDDEGDALADGGVQARALADEVTLSPPEIGGGWLNLVGEWRHRMKSKRLARKGYIKWYRLGAKMSRPTWVKPFRNGDGQMLYYHDGQPYWFDPDAMVTDSRTGAYIAMHRDGEADPVNLVDPLVPGVPVDRLQEALELSVESDQPGFFDRHDIGASEIIALGIAAMLLFGALSQFMGGA